MQSIRIVETLDPINQIKSRLRARCISQSIDPFDFQRLEEAFHRRIVPAISLPTHRLHHPVTIDQIPMFLAGVLHAAIGMHDQSCQRLAPPIRHRKGVAHRLRFHPIAERPPDDSTAAQIQNTGQVQPALVRRNVGQVCNPGLVDPPAIEATFQDIRRHRLRVCRIGGHSIWFAINRPQRLSQQALSHALMSDCRTLRVQGSNNARSAITLPSFGVNHRHPRIEHCIRQRPIARRTGAPLQIAGPRYVQLPTQPCHWVGVAMSLDPGVPHRDSFAKYAAAFFTISRSSLVLASSRRKRLFSASNSAGEPFMGVAADTTSNFPLRLRRIQFPRLDAGIPSRWAAWLMPTDSANRNASCLYSSVYLRFGAVSLAIALSVHQNIIKILMYVETGQGHPLLPLFLVAYRNVERDVHLV